MIQKPQIAQTFEIGLNRLPDPQKIELVNRHFTSQSLSGTSQLYQGKPGDASSMSSTLDALSSLHLGDVAPLLTLEERVASGSLGAVYRASIVSNPEINPGSPPVVVKLVQGEEKIALLRHEAIIYHQAHRLQGEVLPFCYGFYENDTKNAAFIILEDCGQPLIQSFEELSHGTKLSVMQTLKRLHDAGIEHGDLQCWNVLNNHGSLRIIDLHLAMIHECPARRTVMTEEFCFKEAVSELLCEELIAMGIRMSFPSQDGIIYSDDSP